MGSLKCVKPVTGQFDTLKKNSPWSTVRKAHGPLLIVKHQYCKGTHPQPSDPSHPHILLKDLKKHIVQEETKMNGTYFSPKRSALFKKSDKNTERSLSVIWFCMYTYF